MPAVDAILASAFALAAKSRDRLGSWIAPVVRSLRQVSPEKIGRRLVELRDRLLKLWWVAALAAAAAGIVYVLSAWEPVTSAFCSIDKVRSAICRPNGWGGVATPQQEERHRLALRGGCPGLRHYIRTESTESPLYASAKQRWDTRWRKFTRNERLIRADPLTATSASRSSRALALDELIRATNNRAAEICQGYARIPDYHLVSTRVERGEPLCDALGGGWICSAEGRAVCQITWHRKFEDEQC